ncbi:glyoxylase-like metal-dependent hydrolase (beta-lactamase superfamily II) [Silvibacterium bohemicum]|uniref:Glyoxylase-like metal-dependent hydrolase (Beta-lactamase superfamily II) n=1 Tax=Silvibacterium bohemicum TaxID=1577686 RepID=A0A841JSJ4_9BACT|nr:MBL fold metallo-hydrolase [Silvibacterium bohemicum]MBB6144120.1 glyoxylase-like metal-dependent hydrolase (beta-lactamase superfamily II) [Silvibacterium bohemicum]
MKVAFRNVAMALAAVMITAMAVGQGPGINYAKVQFIPQQLAPSVYILTGSAGADAGHPEAAGGRVGILVEPEGVLMVDASYAPLSNKLADAIKQINPGPIRFLVDMHYHPDHTGGNPNFAKLGALIFAREETRQALVTPPPPPVLTAIGDAASWIDSARLPVVTYGSDTPMKIHFDGETVDLIPLPSGHTNGDTMVRFETANVIMIGDFYRNYGYPFVDATRGASFKGTLESIDLLLRTADADTKLVPGHGSLPTLADVKAYREMIVDVRSKVQQMAANGSSLQEVLAAKLTKPYDAKVPGGTDPLPAALGNSADRFISALYAEVKAPR